MASRGKTTQLHNMFVADFETTDSDIYDHTHKKTGQNIYEQRVWLAGYKNLETMQSTYFYSLDDFMSDILSRKNNSNREYGFHNLKFDGSYIIPWLFDNGYTFSFDKPKPKEFTVLVDHMNNWYNITIQPTTKRKITLWDTAKLFPMPLEYLPNVYHTPTKKVKEDSDFYTKHRPIDYVPDDRDMYYFENDLQVPAEVLNKHIEMYGLRFKKTQASQSFYNFEQSFKAWKWRFPALSDEVDSTIRPAYWGGISYVPRRKAGKDFYNIGSMDINSSYPHKAAEKRLPYGDIIYKYGEDQHPNMSKFWIAEAMVEFRLKDNHLPCIPSKGITENRPKHTEKWMTDSNGIVKLIFCRIDYEIMRESYDITIHQWLWSYHWKWRKHKEVARFVHRNNDRKLEYGRMAEQATDQEEINQYLSMRNRAKIDNNGFYGKFGEEVIKIGKVPYQDEEKGVVWKEEKEEVQTEYKRKYLPVAIAITAWGRQQLVEIANILGEHFLYCDTDSIHYLLEGQHKIDKAIKDGIIKMDKHELGAWDYEGTYTRGRYIRAKCYMEETEDGELLSTVAGLPADKHTGQFSKTRKFLTWDNFHVGTIVPKEKSNKLATVSTRTGSKLLPVGYQIKENDSLVNIY